MFKKPDDRQYKELIVKVRCHGPCKRQFSVTMDIKKDALQASPVPICILCGQMMAYTRERQWVLDE